MKNRLIALGIVIAFFAISVLFGFVIGRTVNRTTYTNNSSCNEQLSACSAQLASQENLKLEADGISAPIPEAPGFMRYLSKTGLTFVYPAKLLYSKDKPASEVLVKEVSGEGDVVITLSLADAPEFTQNITYTDVAPGQTAAQYVKNANLTQDPIALQSSDKTLAVRRYAKVLKINALPVNTYAADKPSDDLRVIEFTDHPNTLSYVQFTNNAMFGESIIPFVNSISMVKK